MNLQPQLSKSGVAYRRAMGIPLSAPKMGRGGNYQITEDQAREIWADIQMLAKNCRYRELNICQVVAEHHGICRTLVQNIRSGCSWNQVTGLQRQPRN